jgi:hypothetical protein
MVWLRKGFLERHWEGIPGRPAGAEMLESTIPGAEECKFSVYL